MSLFAIWMLLAQGTTQTAPLPNPYSNTVRRPAPRQRIVRPRVRPIWLGYQQQYETVVQVPAPPPADPLKELIISPVYQKEKFTPKMVEIP